MTFNTILNGYDVTKESVKKDGLITVTAPVRDITGNEIGTITVTGYMFGNDECFDITRFYQLLLSQDGSQVYKLYYNYDVDELPGDPADIDYDHPVEIIDVSYEVSDY